MNARTLAITFALFAATIAFGGIGEADLVTQDVSASCTEVDLGDVTTGCIEGAACKAYERVTGKPANCIE